MHRVDSDTKTRVRHAPKTYSPTKRGSIVYIEIEQLRAALYAVKRQLGNGVLIIAPGVTAEDVNKDDGLGLCLR